MGRLLKFYLFSILVTLGVLSFENNFDTNSAKEVEMLYQNQKKPMNRRLIEESERSGTKRMQKKISFKSSNLC